MTVVREKYAAVAGGFVKVKVIDDHTGEEKET